MRQIHKTFVIRALIAVILIALVGTASVFAYTQMTQPAESKTQLQTDVKTKDIIIKSERDLTNAENELESMQVEDREGKSLDKLGDGL